MFFGLQFLGVAAEAQAVVAADKHPAFFTLPLFLLSNEKCFNAFFLDEFQVSYHTHMVVLAIPLVDMFDPVTGEGAAPETIMPAVFFQFRAVFDAAVCASMRLIVVIAPAARALLLVPQICCAQGTVHAAGGDEFFSEGHIHFN